MIANFETVGTCHDIQSMIFQGQPAKTFLLRTSANEFQVYALDKRISSDLYEGMHTKVIGERFHALGFSCIEAAHVDESGRICSHCGKHHYEGYFLDDAGQYACSEECAIALYDGDAEAFHEDCDFIGGIVYWTEWYD